MVGVPQLQEGAVQRVADRKQRAPGNGTLQTKTYPFWPCLPIIATQLPETMPPAGKQGFQCMWAWLWEISQGWVTCLMAGGKIPAEKQGKWERVCPSIMVGEEWQPGLRGS